MRFAIDNFVLGTNAKMNVGFDGRFWAGADCSGETWSGRANHQLTWEVSPSLATDLHAVIVDYSGGERGATLNPNNGQQEAALWLAECLKFGRRYLTSCISPTRMSRQCLRRGGRFVRGVRLAIAAGSRPETGRGPGTSAGHGLHRSDPIERRDAERPRDRVNPTSVPSRLR
ncbi:MAG: hypothetical protein L0210_00240 [Rhodospirillales bacterium]|nr:hypothetical protein [Rhodospirillales bacterium]